MNFQEAIFREEIFSLDQFIIIEKNLLGKEKKEKRINWQWDT